MGRNVARGLDWESVRASLGLVALIGAVVASLYLWDWLTGDDDSSSCSGTRGYENCEEQAPEPADLGPEDW